MCLVKKPKISSDSKDDKDLPILRNPLLDGLLGSIAATRGGRNSLRIDLGSGGGLPGGGMPSSGGGGGGTSGGGSGGTFSGGGSGGGTGFGSGGGGITGTFSSQK